MTRRNLFPMTLRFHSPMTRQVFLAEGPLMSLPHTPNTRPSETLLTDGTFDGGFRRFSSSLALSNEVLKGFFSLSKSTRLPGLVSLIFPSQQNQFPLWIMSHSSFRQSAPLSDTHMFTLTVIDLLLLTLYSLII